MTEVSCCPNALYSVESSCCGVNRKPGGRRPVVGQIGLQAAILLVGVHVLQPGQFLHVGEQDRSPLVQVFDVVGLNRVLVERGTGAAADADVLRGLQKRLRHREAVELRTEPVDDARGVDFAFAAAASAQCR